jgi:hypothetical protein
MTMHKGLSACRKFPGAFGVHALACFGDKGGAASDTLKRGHQTLRCGRHPLSSIPHLLWLWLRRAKIFARKEKMLVALSGRFERREAKLCFLRRVIKQS